MIDMLLMSLYYYQQAHNEKQLSIFIDEIKTQNLSTKGSIAKIHSSSEIMNNADIHAFFHLDDRTATSVARLLRVNPQELTLLEKGECYIKGTFYNQNRQAAIPGVLHGKTYRNFRKQTAKNPKLK